MKRTTTKQQARTQTYEETMKQMKRTPAKQKTRTQTQKEHMHK